MHEQQSWQWVLATAVAAALAVMIGTQSNARAGGETSDPTTPGAIACCLNTADQQGCESLLPADCTAAGGVDAGAGKTCDPDPCQAQGASPDGAGDMPGDCNGNGSVTVDEMVKCVGIALGTAPLDECPSADAAHTGQVTVDDLVQMINESFNGRESTDATPPAGTIACCLNAADQQGCEDLLPADCTAAGGVDSGTGTCDPDPCPNTGPNDGGDGGPETSHQAVSAFRQHHH